MRQEDYESQADLGCCVARACLKTEKQASGVSNEGQRGLLGVSQVTTDGLSRCQVSETSCMGGDSRPLLSPRSALPCQSLLHTAGDLFSVGAG